MKKRLKWLIVSVFASIVFGAGTLHAGLELSKSVVGNLTQVSSGQQFTYRLSYRAASTTMNFTNVVLTDVLPAELDYISVQGTSHTTNIVYTSSTRTLRAYFVNPLPAGSTGQIDVNVRFKRGSTLNGAVATNIASLVAANASAVTSSPVIVRALAGVTLSAAKTLVNPSVPLNEAITYTVKAQTATQIGALTVTNIVMVDQLPTNAVFVSATSGGVYDAATHTVRWLAGNVIPGTTDSISRNVTIAYPDTVFALSNKVINVVNVTGTAISGEPVSCSAAITNTIVAPTYGVNCVKSTSDNYLYIGKPAAKTYSFGNVQNTGNTALRDVVLTDPIPPQVRVTSIYTGSYSGSPSGLGTGITVEYQTTAKAWTTVAGSPFSGASSQQIKASTLGLVAGEEITAVRWSFGDLPATYLVATPKMDVDVLTTTDRNGTAIVVNQVITNTATLAYTDYVGPKTKVTSANLTIRSQRPVAQVEKGFVTGTTIAHGATGAFYIRLRNTVYAAEPLDNPVVADLLPAELIYQEGSYTLFRAPTNAPAPTFETISNYRNTGRTLLRWSWTGDAAYALPTNDYVEIRFAATQPVGTLYGSKANTATLCSWSNAVLDVSSTSSTSDTTDLDGDGKTSETVYYKTFSWTVPSDVSMDSQKWVKGTLDNEWTRYPDSSSVPGGRADYRLLVRNSGNVPIRDVVVTDILPFIGDTGVIDLSARESEWRPNLAGPVVAPTNAVVYYSTEENPLRTDFVASGPAGASPANWTLDPPGNITRVRALRFVFQNYTLQPQQTMELTWPMRVPVGAPTGSNVAWNSFGFYGTRTDSSTTLLASEPLKVGVKTVMDTHGAFGDRIWFDANKDGIQQPEEAGVNGVRVELWEDSSESSVPDGIINTNVDRYVGWTITGDDQDGNGGYYLFPGLTRGSYYARFQVPNPYVVTARQNGSDPAADSDIDLAAYYTPIVELADKERNLTLDAGVWLPPYGVQLTVTAGSAPDASVFWTNINQSVVYAYHIVNTGSLDLVDLKLSDSLLGTITNLVGLLPAGGSTTVYFPYPSVLANVTNLATVLARPADTNGVEISGAPQASSQDDAVVQLYVTLGGRVWDDLDADGIQDAGEPSTSGVTVTLYDAADQPLTNAVTAANGTYRFSTLYPGTYRVGVTRPSASDQASPISQGSATTDSNADPVTGKMAQTTLVSGESQLAWDAGFYRLASIGNRVWNDADLDGIQDVGEAGLAGVTVRLLDSLGATVASMNTDSQGLYLFENLVPGTYKLQIVVPEGRVLSAKDKGGNDATDSDADPTTGLTVATPLISNESDLTWDFGLFTPAPAVSIIKTAGTAANGETYAADFGSDVVYTYVVTNSGNTWFKPVVVTDDKLGTVGTVAALAPGASATLTATGHNMMANTRNVGTVTATPSDAYTRTLGAALTAQDDAYVTVQGVLGASRVWQDDNRNGIQDPAEAGIANVTVILYNASNEEVARTTTAADGRYSFGEIAAGSYTVAFVAPQNYYFTRVNQGTDDLLDSDADPVTGRTGTIVLQGGQTQAGWDAGLYRAVPGIQLVKTAGSAADGQDFIVYGHGDVTYVYTVKNTGESYLANIVVTDDKLGSIGTVAGPLAPNAQVTLSVTVSNVTAGVVNIGTVTANPVDETGEDLPTVSDVSDTDDAVVVVLPRATLSGHVWIDAYRDGVRVDPELGLVNVTVILLDASGVGVSTNKTIADGTYFFDDIIPGDYRVQVVLPSETWHFTTQNSGADDAIDSDVDTTTGITEVFTLASGEDATGIDAGLYGGLPPGFCDNMTFGKTFNAIIAGDFQANGGDTEGRLAVGGTAWFGVVGYSVGFALAGEPIAPSDASTDRLIVGNDLYDGTFDVNGNIVYGGERQGPTRYLTNTLLRAVSPVTLTPEGNVPEDGSGMTFEQITASIRLASAMIGNMDNRGVTNMVKDAWSYLLQGDDPVLNIFNVAAADWNVLKSENRIEVPEGSTVIVNIHGDGCSFVNGAITIVGTATNNVLFNYVDATTFTSTSVDHPGGVLAPYADGRMSGGAINGFAFFGGSVITTNGFEFHNFPFRGQICDEGGEQPRIAVSLIAGTAAEGAVYTIQPGADVALTYRVTNAGNTWLRDVTVTDADLGLVGLLIDPLAPGESALLTNLATSVTTNHTFMATVTAKPTDEVGTSSELYTAVSATDVAAVRVVAAAGEGGSGEGGSSGGSGSSSDSERPDFAVTSVDLITKPTLTGDVFSVQIIIDNHGEVGADAGKVSLYLSAPTAVTSATPATITFDAGYLQPGESKIFVVENLVAGNAPGTHHLRAFVDSQGAVKEWSDGDNQLTAIYALNAIYMNVAVTPEGVLLSWNSFWGQRYTLQQCTNLTFQFASFMTNVVATPPTNAVLVTPPAGGSAFYKLFVEE